MLKGLDARLGPDLLHVLAMMGHGDEIALVDTNFPAHSVAAGTIYGSALAIGADMTGAVGAVLSLLPLDRFVSAAAVTMQVVDDASAIPEAVAEVTPLILAEGVGIEAIERFAFYQRARSAFAIVQTLETRVYGNIILKKGVIAG